MYQYKIQTGGFTLKVMELKLQAAHANISLPQGPGSSF